MTEPALVAYRALTCDSEDEFEQCVTELSHVPGLDLRALRNQVDAAPSIPDTAQVPPIDELAEEQVIEWCWPDPPWPELSVVRIRYMSGTSAASVAFSLAVQFQYLSALAHDWLGGLTWVPEPLIVRLGRCAGPEIEVVPSSEATGLVIAAAVPDSYVTGSPAATSADGCISLFTELLLRTLFEATLDGQEEILCSADERGVTKVIGELAAMEPPLRLWYSSPAHIVLGEEDGSSEVDRAERD